MQENARRYTGNSFVIRRSEIEGRIDPHQYHFDRLNAIEKIKRNRKILKLKEVVKSKKTVVTEIKGTDVYIGLENIASDTGSYLPTTAKQSISSAGVFKKGQILFPKLRPYLNKIYLAEFDGLCSTEFHILESTHFNSEFLSIYLRSELIVNQTKHLMTGNTLPRLQTEDINNLPVPDISLELQKDIVEYYRTKSLEAKDKENAALGLLRSIDIYILEELGIVVPERKSSINDRIFTALFSDVTGNRFDPKLYDNSTKALQLAIAESPFPKIPLKKLIVHSASGDWGEDDNFSNPNDYVRCLVIRATEFDNTGNLKLDNSRVKHRLINTEKLKRIDIRVNDLLIEKSGGSPDQPVGRVALLTEEILQSEEICYSNFIHKIRVNEATIHAEYLFHFLKAVYNMKLTDAMQSQTNGIRNLIFHDYFRQLIVFPTHQAQEKILRHISDLYVKANILKSEATNLLALAKSEVVRMIIG